jgi:hypothetical protein
MDNGQMKLQLSSSEYETNLDAALCSEKPPIAVTITHPTQSGGLVTGFLHLWAKYLRGFNHKVHCQHSLRGPLSSLIKTKSTPIETTLFLSEVRDYDSLYICGVASGPVSARGKNNLHLPLEQCPGVEFVYRTYNNYLLYIENAIILPIPELPRGWNGLPDSYTRCCNFRFCTHRFGYPTEPGRQDALHRSWHVDSIRECGKTGMFGRALDAQLDQQTPTSGEGA